MPREEFVLHIPSSLRASLPKETTHIIAALLEQAFDEGARQSGRIVIAGDLHNDAKGGWQDTDIVQR